MSDDAGVTSAKNDVSSSPTKKSRTTVVSRATAEGEALLKEMGFDDKETPGRRRTRAAIRGDVYTPPIKKERKASTPGTGRRGRPPKKVEKSEDKKEAKKEEKKEDKKEEKADEKEEEADGNTEEEEEDEEKKE